MTDSTKPLDEHPIQIGGSPTELLKSRGGKYESVSVLPQMPDVLGYVLGLMLIWLLYTGYHSVVTLFTSPDSAVVKFGVKAKSLTQQTANIITADPNAAKVIETIKDASSPQNLEAALKGLERGQLNDKPEEDMDELPQPQTSKKGWTARQLKNLNVRIDHWSKAVGQSMKGMFDDSDTDETTSEDSAVVVQDEPAVPEKKPETYEWF